MEFQLPINIRPLPRPIYYKDHILLMGSCFTEHIGDALSEVKFSTFQNPNGILFDPLSGCKSLISYTQNRHYKESDLFQLNEVWHSWQHHSKFSGMNPEVVIRTINESQQKAHAFIKKADWIIITLGSAFSYRLNGLTPNPSPGGEGSNVANCHRAPAQWFDKKLLETDSIVSKLGDCITELLKFNPKLNFIFTVSPVRHVRDGVVENNRSKARLIESVHHIVEQFEQAHYFPAYELVIDVLRDYRFYDIDLVHPNYAATDYVLEKFADSCIDTSSRELMTELKDIIIARKHKAFQPATTAHRQFLRVYHEKTKALKEKYPFLDLEKELIYFNS